MKSKAPPIKRDNSAIKKGRYVDVTIGISCSDAASSSGVGGALRLERIRALVKSKTKENSKRGDKPPEYNLIRGSKAVALQVASDIDALTAAETAYEKDWTAAGDTSNYFLITWIELHLAYGKTKGLGDWDAFPSHHSAFTLWARS